MSTPRIALADAGPRGPRQRGGPADGQVGEQVTAGVNGEMCRPAPATHRSSACRTYRFKEASLRSAR